MAQVSARTTAQQLAAFHILVGDTLDTTAEEDLLNEVKDELEADDDWVILKAIDTSQTAAVADDYLTMKTLPADYGEVSQHGIYVGNDQLPYLQVPFEDRMRFKDVTHRFYIDEGNGQYALCGKVSQAGTIQFPYKKSSRALTVSGNETWVFPARFHKILPYLMAIKYFAIDQGDKSRAYDDRWDIHSDKILSTMRRWNARLKVQGSQNRALSVDLASRPDVVDMDGGGNMVIYG